VSCECICSLIVPGSKTSDGVAQTYTAPWADSAQDRSRLGDPAHVTYCQRYYGARGIWTSCTEVGVFVYLFLCVGGNIEDEPFVGTNSHTIRHVVVTVA
jgi:hypothetical protein